jgi:hypothetical protein
MNINIPHRKKLMQQTRQFQDNIQWVDYLENTYPEWWYSIYKDKWPVRIIYYNNDNSYVEFYLHTNRYSTMESIMKKLYLLLNAQLSAISACFGQDIATIINQYMPTPFDLYNNYLYYHARPLDVNDPNQKKTRRVRLNTTTTLNELICAQRCVFQMTRYTNLRLRSLPYVYPPSIIL